MTAALLEVKHLKVEFPGRRGTLLALDDISFEGPDQAGTSVTIDDAYVTKMLADIVKNEDLSRYIL